MNSMKFLKRIDDFLDNKAKEKPLSFVAAYECLLLCTKDASDYH